MCHRFDSGYAYCILMVYNSLQISKILEISYEPLNMPIPRGNIDVYKIQQYHYTIEHIAEEAGDVRIMIMQIEHLLGIQDAVEDSMKRKIDRQIGRMKEADLLKQGQTLLDRYLESERIRIVQELCPDDVPWLVREMGERWRVNECCQDGCEKCWGLPLKPEEV